MLTTFVFIEHLTEETFLTVSLDEHGQVVHPLAQKAIADIQALQKSTHTIVVLPTSLFSLHQISFPRVSEKKARAALAFALEDKLAQPADSLHIAFSRHHYEDGQYLVVVSDKHALASMIAKLDALAISFNTLTLNWFALKHNEAAILESSLIVYDEAFQGALTPDLASFYVKQPSISANPFHLYRFTDSQDSLVAMQTEPLEYIEEPCCLWIAKRLLQTKPMNLCQGELEQTGMQSRLKRWLQATAGMTVLLLVSIVIKYWVIFHHLNQDTIRVDTQIASIYHQFFPNAQHIISPKFRITQWLKSNKKNADQGTWYLLNTLAKTFNPNAMTIQQLRMQNQTVSVTLSTSNFEALEQLQTHLQQEKITIRQTQASNEKNKILSTLELSL